MLRVTLTDKKKINIQRDYSTGTCVRFKNEYPREICGLISEDDWSSFISELNIHYEDAEKVTRRTIIETVLGLFTCYLSSITPSGYQAMDRIDEFICEKNEKLFISKGIYVANPMERGLRALEVTLIHEKPDVQKVQPPEIYQNIPRSPLVPR